MIYLTRIYLVLFIFFITSCTSNTVNYDYTYFNLLKSLYPSKQKEDLDNNYLNSIEFSYIKVKQGKNIAILVLNSISNNKYEWIGVDDLKIITFKGVVIDISGINSPFKIVGVNSLNELMINKKINFQIKNPDLYSEFEITSLNILENSLYIEFYDDAINWSGLINIDFSNTNNNPINTYQSINPFQEDLEIQYVYKY